MSSSWTWLFDNEEYGRDERGRQRVNNHGDVDVVRSSKTMHPVQLPVEYGCLVTIDGRTERFVGFRGDALLFIEPDVEVPERYEDPVSCTSEGVHHFNTRVRNADEVSVRKE